MADIPGTSGNDSLTGTTDADTIIGAGGSDTIDGSGGDDSIFGDSAGTQVPQPADTTDTSTGINYQIISLGSVLDDSGGLVFIDPDETGGTSGFSENGGELNTETFGSTSDPLSDNVVTMVAGFGNGDGQYDGDNTLSSETFFINGTEYTFDGSAVYNDTIVTFEDGSTATVSAVVFQDTSGNLYLAPEFSNNADTAIYTSQPITSIELGTQDTTGSFGNGLTLERVVDSWVENSATEVGPDGNDVINGGAGNDTIFGEGGDDIIDGEDGADVIFGDGGELVGTFEGPRESFNWEPLDSSDADGTVQQDTGDVVVTYTRLQDTGSHQSDIDDSTNLNTSGIDSGSETIDTNSSLTSVTNGQTNVGEFQWEFSEPVGNVDFNINDLDGDGLVTVTAFDADDNPVEVVLTGGSDILVTDNVADAVGPYQDVNDPDTTVQVSIAGPVSRIVVEHTQNGSNNSGIHITDLYYDTGFVVSSDSFGDDTIDGGADDDLIYGDNGPGTGEVVGPNLIENGSFEDVSGLTGTHYGFVGDGSIPGWTEASGDKIDVHNDERDGQVATDGENWLDLESSPGNLRVGQDVQGLSDGETYRVSFDANDGPSLPTSGSGENEVNVYWNGELIDTIDPNNSGGDTTWDSYSYDVVAGSGDGSNRLEFEGTGTQDNFGVAIDNVEMYLVDTAGGDDGAGGNDVITGGAGADTMLGEGGDDTFIVATASDADGDVIDGGNGPDGTTDTDVLDLRGTGQVTIVEAVDPNDAGATAGTVTFENGEVLTFEGIETILTDPQPDGTVDGEDFAENMDLGYDDSNAPTDGGGDLITSGADSIEGNGGDDTINGAGGNDTIDGGTGADFITGGAGDDSVLGGDGDDDIVVGGEDSAEGGIGDDEFRVDGTDSAPDINATIDGGSDGTQPGDAAGPENGDAGDILNLGSQSDDLTVDLTDNNDPESGTVDGLDTIAGDDDLTFEEIERIITGSGDDTVDGTGTTGPLDVTTGGGNDSVLGSDGDDSVDAGPGNDTVNGGDGSDTVDGGEGDNLIDTRGNVIVDPVTGREISGTPDLGYPGLFAGDSDPNDDRDVVTTGSGNDTITTGDDADVINAGDGDNDIDGGLDNDTITAGSGNDLIVGGEGSDSILSGDGNDTIYAGNDPSVPDAVNIPDADVGGLSPDLVPENGKDFVDAGAGNDVVFGADDDDTILGGSGNDVLDGGIDDDSIEGGEGIDIIIGGQGDDTLLGGDDTDLIVGGDDNDSILGGDGVDILDGEAGDDFVDGGADSDLIFGEGGKDTLIGSEGEDLVLGGDGNDTIYGDDTLNEGNNADGAGDILFGGAGNDNLFGGAGDDLIDGGEGADIMEGGDDRDTFIEVGPGDVIDGGEGGVDFDTIVLSGPALIEYDPFNPENGTIRFIDLATQTEIGAATFTNIEDVTFVQPEAHPPLVENDVNSDPDVDPLDVDIFYNAPVTPDASPPSPATAPEGHVDGTSGDDIMGFDPAYVDVDGDAMDSGDAILTGEVGDDDIVRAYGGNDTIFSGLGNDEVFAGEGNDQVQAGDGNDVVRGQDGNDILAGGDGNDRMRGDDGNDLLFGEDGNDQLEGGDGDDTLNGGANDDVLFAGDGNDSLVGGTGNNIMLGGTGNDTLDGGNNPGIDDVYGENDADLFVGFGAGDTINGGSGGVDNDTLDLSGSGAFVLVENDGVTPLDLSTPNDADGNSFSGQVNFLDAGGAVTGTLTFSEIENIIPCFTPGTLIATPTGERLVEDLREGDRIITRDNGLQQIRWVGRRDLSGQELVNAPHLMPVLIRAGSLGHGLPERDMMVSPQHRMLINNDRSALYFEDREVLAAAKHLTGMEGVDSVEASSVSYIHFMFDQHEVVLSNGAWTESFQPGETVMDAMGEAQRKEIFDLFPELLEKDGLEAYTSARRSLKKHEAKLLVK